MADRKPWDVCRACGCFERATHLGDDKLLLWCTIHAQAVDQELTSAEVAAAARRAEMRAVLDALGKAWERSPELALEHMLRDVTNYPCTLGDNDARLLSRLEKWRK